MKRNQVDNRKMEVTFGPPENLSKEEQIRWRIQRPYKLECDTVAEIDNLMKIIGKWPGVCNCCNRRKCCCSGRLRCGRARVMMWCVQCGVVTCDMRGMCVVMCYCICKAILLLCGVIFFGFRKKMFATVQCRCVSFKTKWTACDRFLPSLPDSLPDVTNRVMSPQPKLNWEPATWWRDLSQPKLNWETAK